MSSLSTTSIKRPVLAIVMNIIIILFGYIGFKYLGVREYPSIDPPIVNVRTSYPGANADVIESQITEPLEKAINSIDGIRTISSASNQGSSNITVEFNLSKDLDDAANDVRDKVSQAARSLPKDVDGLPVVSKADANSDAIISMTLQSNTRNQLEVSDYAENVLAERLQTIPGVSSIQIWGQKRYAMRLWIDPIRLASYGLTTLDVKNALDRENVQLPTGKITGDNTELTVNATGNMSTEEEFNNLIIKNDGANIIRLSDVGRAVLGPENEETMLRESGIPMIGLALVPQPGANYIDISNEFYKRYEQIKKDLPKDYKTDIALDNTIFIKKSINEVVETLGVALILVVLIIYIFFRNWGIAFRPLIDIPVSLIGTFFIMYLMGFSINVLTLLAIVLATGLVVDDGIVVTENIYKKVEEGLSPFEAAIKGSNEIFFAIISTSITLAAVFLPIIFLEGFVGRLFREFGIVISAAVLISAFVSLTLTPMLNAKLIRKNQKQSRFYELTEPLFVNMVESYRSSLNSFLSKRWMAFPLIGLCVVMIFFFGKMLQSELAPLDDRNFISLSVTAPEGASYDYTDNFLKKITQTVMDSIPEKQVLLTVTAPGFGNSATNTGFGRLRLKDPDQRTRSQQQIADYLTKLTSGMSEARTFVIQQQTISAGGGRGLPIQYVLQAPTFEKLKEILPKFMEAVQKDPTFTMTDVNLKFNKPELNITIDRDKAKALGVSFVDVAQTLQLGLSGQRFGYYIMNGKQYQVIGQFDRSDREDPSNLTSIFVRNNQNKLIQMDNLIKIEENSSPPQLYHFNRFTSATVSAGIAPGKTIGDGIAAMDAIKKKVLDDSYQTSLNGASRDFAESSSNIMFAFVLALVLIYLILAAQFESFVDPLIIMITVPLAIAGAVFSLWLFNQTINIFSQIGIIMLVGLVTKNGILIVEFANQLKERGVPLQKAIRDSAAARLRPILMTSLATALGALPIAMALGDAAKSRMSMGIVVIGGILFSLALTLFVIPAIYSYMSQEHKPHPDEHASEDKDSEPKLITAEA
ncbi:efflux RND transporter permease subunit [Solitalea sp. MAHUQ-68]|uniref:Efflux RND transporter permease subunit n=1 Tax=Solitalea agri TaxID=2953739 RepID=A0A9X2F2T2_9SPHI|nr:efflux RND transporter permease subunit [Solitalea agri]MCO4293669.1 efflux RND transporter permease subunit [Solitalea agri]